MLYRKTVLTRRVHVKTSAHQTVIRIDRPFNWKSQQFGIVFSALFLVFSLSIFPWARIWSTSLPRPWPASILALTFPLVFVAAPIVMGLGFAARCYREDTLTIQSDHFVLERRVLVWNRKVSGSVQDIDNLRIEKGWPTSLIRDVAFRFQGRTYRFGSRILIDEAAEVTSQLQQLNLKLRN
jgi:hypothetical protein